MQRLPPFPFCLICGGLGTGEANSLHKPMVTDKKSFLSAAGKRQPGKTDNVQASMADTAGNPASKG